MSEAFEPAPDISADPSDRRAMLADALDALPEAQSEAPEAIDPAPAGERPRGPDGKFLPASAAADPEAANSPATAGAAEAAAETPPDPYVTPPQSWKKELHEEFTKASPALRAYVSQREDEMRRGIEPLIPKARFADEIGQVMAPYQANIQAAGVAPVAAIQTLMQADNVLRNAPMHEKVAYARQLLAQYGVDLGGDPSAPYTPPDPRYSHLTTELSSIKGQLTQFQQAQQQAEAAAMQSEIETFAQSNEHFETLRPRMAELMQKGLAPTLQDAYSMALRLDDNLSATVHAAALQAKQDADRKEAADKAAKAARAAAVSVRSSTPGRAPPTKAQDRRSLLAEQLDGLSERV